jgi:tetratricopeptide (TPR) repeat protein
MAFATPILRPISGLAGALFLLAGVPETSADTLSAERETAAYARRNFEAAQAHYRRAPGEASAAWQFGRACFEVAEFATNRTERAALAEEGITACRLAIARASNSAPAHYYLGMNLGQLARTKGLGALRLVGQMEQAFARARELDERLDYAGADRHLGVLYRDAPTIGSVGSRTQARAHLRHAAELAPQYPENRLNLIEAYVKWGDRSDAARELQALAAAWPGLRTNYVGAAWAASWADWDQRLQKLKKKIEQPNRSLDSPREKQ